MYCKKTGFVNVLINKKNSIAIQIHMYMYEHTVHINSAHTYITIAIYLHICTYIPLFASVALVMTDPDVTLLFVRAKLRAEWLHYIRFSLYTYRIYPNKSRAHINAWAQINAGVQHSKVNKHLCKMQKGLI